MDTMHHIHSETCEHCGLCVDVCPNRILEAEKGAEPTFRPERLTLCVSCGHCMAVCPTRSVRIPGLSYERDFFDLPEGDPGESPFFDLIASRRAIRLYRKKPVPREVLERIVHAVSLAPMGFPPHKCEVTVVESRETIEQALPHMISFYEDLQRWMTQRISRFFMKRRMPEETFHTLENHVLPEMRLLLPVMKREGIDLIARGAPALFLFHADRTSENHSEDALIALTYAFLAAHALGLGATPISLIPPAVERVPPLRDLFHIPRENEVVAAMIAGYPKVRFKRGIRREMAGVTFIA